MKRVQSQAFWGILLVVAGILALFSSLGILPGLMTGVWVLLFSAAGAAFLYVRRQLQEEVRPACISHGANSPRTDRSRFLQEFDWTGTLDPTPILAIPAAIQFVEENFPGGWPGLRDRNRKLALDGRALVLQALGMPAPAPDSMLASMVA